jgi:two-component system, NtrC family, response regulator HydG
VETNASGPPPTLLVVDDDPEVLAIIDRFAGELGFTVVGESSGRAAIASLSLTKPDVALIELRMPDIDGLAVLREMQAADSRSEVVLMTGQATVDTAIDAIKAGALDYLTKPFDFDRLRELLITVRKRVERRETFLRIDAGVAKQFEFYGLIGRTPAMQELFDSVRRFAPHTRTVLITGETGTGKELVARALHKLGPRRERPLVTVNCSAVVETLFESELFGHVRGAFTGASEAKTGLFEHAHGGTIFLDEVGELPLSMQAKLLRAVELGEVQRVGAVQTRSVDVSAIAATNRDLRVESSAGRFRSDLYYRLSILELRLSPLRDRREDIPYLTAAFVKEFAEQLGRPIKGITLAAERLLQRSPWPGNVRELRNVLQRACILSDNKILTERELANSMSPAPPEATASLSPEESQPQTPDDAALLSTVQRDQITRVLRLVGGNKAAAAKQLGMSRRSLYRWLDRLDIQR